MPAGLITDLYELTMAAGYLAAGKQHDRAVFELFLRRLPAHRNFVLAAGLQQAAGYLLNLRYDAAEIAYLRGLPVFAHAPAEFWDYLAAFRFTGDLFAVPEGTPVFGGEPLLTVRAPIIEAQIPETFLLATVGFQSLIASKAARVAHAAAGRAVVEFGTRRAHSPEAGTLGARAAYIGGCAGTSNVEAGFRYGIPVFGTAAHSWVTAFDSEREAFARLQQLLGPGTVQLVDTYDTLEGTRHAAALGPPLWGIRLDSGDLDALSRAARRILDDAGLRESKIMASGDLNERKVDALVRAGCPIDSFGVGTELATSIDAPALGVVYKLVELHPHGGARRFPVKFSPAKKNLPGSKQIFRYAGRDLVGGSWECFGECDGSGPAEALLRPVILGGRLVEPLPDVHAARDHARRSLERLPESCRSLYDQEQPYPVEYSAGLEQLYEAARREEHA